MGIKGSLEIDPALVDATVDFFAGLKSTLAKPKAQRTDRDKRLILLADRYQDVISQLGRVNAAVRFLRAGVRSQGPFRIADLDFLVEGFYSAMSGVLDRTLHLVNVALDIGWPKALEIRITEIQSLTVVATNKRVAEPLGALTEIIRKSSTTRNRLVHRTSYSAAVPEVMPLLAAALDETEVSASSDDIVADVVRALTQGATSTERTFRNHTTGLAQRYEAECNLLSRLAMQASLEAISSSVLTSTKEQPKTS